jgi:hypothetical protein
MFDSCLQYYHCTHYYTLLSTWNNSCYMSHYTHHEMRWLVLLYKNQSHTCHIIHIWNRFCLLFSTILRVHRRGKNSYLFIVTLHTYQYSCKIIKLTDQSYIFNSILHRKGQNTGVDPSFHYCTIIHCILILYRRFPSAIDAVATDSWGRDPIILVNLRIHSEGCCRSNSIELLYHDATTISCSSCRAIPGPLFRYPYPGAVATTAW